MTTRDGQERAVAAAEDASTRDLLGDTGSPVHARVEAFWDGGRASAWLAPDATLRIGRGSDSGLQILDASVSRDHALLRGGAPAYVEDLGSANGVTVRGRKLPPRTAVAVAAGDVITVGAAVIVIQQPPGTFADRSAASIDGALASESRMAAVQRLLDLAARSELSILLLGETGVGKTTAAEHLHARSARASGPFLKIHCPSFPEALLESELFGHERGAFTGATQSKQGLIESAEGGTVFLDEIGELPHTTQAKLLSVVESREVQRLGSLRSRTVDVRFVAATNRDLEAHVAAGAFRQDLYFRLNGLSIVIPPLRERVAEIAPLARRLLEQAASRARRPVPLLADSAIALLERQRWPGNVRELRNLIERAVALTEDPVLDAEQLAALGGLGVQSARPQPATPAAANLRDELDSVERQRIVQALERCGGNQGEVAKLLGISRRTLIRRLEAYGLPRPRKG